MTLSQLGDRRKHKTIATSAAENELQCPNVFYLWQLLLCVCWWLVFYRCQRCSGNGNGGRRRAVQNIKKQFVLQIEK